MGDSSSGFFVVHDHQACLDGYEQQKTHKHISDGFIDFGLLVKMSGKISIKDF
ncbi:MAG: hypothetical protein IKX31_11075 [Muribaculaceae bacterium]|nr:hypothetical protein [Muribaculaceae bacterium]